jgi:hypothetical protein
MAVILIICFVILAGSFCVFALLLNSGAGELQHIAGPAS